MSWKKAWQPTSVFLPGESHGQRSLACYSPWSRRVGHDWSDWACMQTKFILIWKMCPKMCAPTLEGCDMQLHTSWILTTFWGRHREVWSASDCPPEHLRSSRKRLPEQGSCALHWPGWETIPTSSFPKEEFAQDTNLKPLPWPIPPAPEFDGKGKDKWRQAKIHGFHSSCAVQQLCDLRQTPSPLWASFSSLVVWKGGLPEPWDPSSP